MSETLKTILNHWTDEEQFQGETGHLDLPFDIEAFCIEMDNRIRELEQPWISVDERLPETDIGTGMFGGEDILVTDGKFVWPAIYERGRYMSIDGPQEWGRFKADNVTHWMPLPEPPK